MFWKTRTIETGAVITSNGTGGAVHGLHFGWFTNDISRLEANDVSNKRTLDLELAPIGRGLRTSLHRDREGLENSQGSLHSEPKSSIVNPVPNIVSREMLAPRAQMMTNTLEGVLS